MNEEKREMLPFDVDLYKSLSYEARKIWRGRYIEWLENSRKQDKKERNNMKSKIYAFKNKDKIKEFMRKYHKLNSEKLNKKRRERFKNDSAFAERVRLKSREYYQNNKERIKDFNKLNYEKYKVSMLASSRKYYLKNKDKINERRRKKYAEAKQKW